MRRSNIMFSLKTISPNWSTFLYRSLLSFPSHRATRSSSLIALSRPSLTSTRLRIANYHSAPVLWNNLQSDLRHHATPSPILNSPVSDLSTSLFLKQFKTHLFHCSFPPVCIHLCYLRTDISGIDQASLFHLILILISFTLISCMLILFYLTCVYDYVVQLLRHYWPKSPPFHTVIRIHLIVIVSLF